MVPVAMPTKSIGDPFGKRLSCHYQGWLMDRRQDTGGTRLISFIAWFKKEGRKEYSVDI